MVEMGDTGEWEKSTAVGVRTGFVSRGTIGGLPWANSVHTWIDRDSIIIGRNIASIVGVEWGNVIRGAWGNRQVERTRAFHHGAVEGPSG